MTHASIIALLTALRRRDPSDKIGTAKITGIDAYGKRITETIDVYRDGSGPSQHDYSKLEATKVTLY